MNAGNIELFIQPSILDAVSRDRDVILSFGELRRKHFDSAITAQFSLFKRHDLIANEANAAFQKNCAEYVGEIARQIFASMCTSKARSNIGFEVLLTWMRKFCEEMKACLSREEADRKRAKETAGKLPPFEELRRVMMQRLLDPPPATNEVEEFFGEFCRALKARLGSDLLWLADSLNGYPTLRYGSFCAWLSEPASDLTALRETCAALEERETEHRAAEWRVERKILTSLERLLRPIADRIDADIAEENATFITTMMMKIYARMYSHFAPQLFQPQPRVASLHYDYFGTQITLQYLFQTEVSDWKILAEALATLVEAPRLFARWPCAPENQPVKALLRNFTELAAGPVEFPVERAYLLARLSATDVCREEALCLACEYLGMLCTTKEAPSRVKQLLDPIVTGWIDDMPGWMKKINLSVRKYRLRRTDDVEFEKLLAEESAASEEMARLQSAWSEYRPETPQDETEPSSTATVETIRLSYVENLGSELWRTHKIECAREDLMVSLDIHLLDANIDIVVPVSSIARAIEHYLYAMSPEQRLLVPMERIAGENWRKLKRGAQRIYILEKEGEIFLHLMKRKDWAVAATQEARY